MSRIVIFANGILENPAFLLKRLQPGDRIFCADGGTYHALALGLSPEMIVGDLDSLTAETIAQMEATEVTFRRYSENKDQTDLELALDIAVAERPEEILLVTALGGRLDQALANILLLTQPKYGSVKLSLLDGLQSAIVLRDYSQLTIEGEPGDILSLVPLTPQVTGVNFSGVGWPLAQATLRLGSTWSISNVLKERQARVEIDEGMVLLVHLTQNRDGS
jgi:thiamine pyrophosphokinase